MIEHDFPEVRKIAEAGATRKQINDYELTRYSVGKEEMECLKAKDKAGKLMLDE